jgi:hypothetical protein
MEQKAGSTVVCSQIMVQRLQTGSDSCLPHHSQYIIHYYLSINYFKTDLSLTATTFPFEVTTDVFKMRR